MYRHRFDGLSFLFGLFFVGVAMWVILAGADPGALRGGWMWPALLVAGAVVLAASVLESRIGERSGGDAAVISGDAPAGDDTA